jgi:hypothetical protein
LGGKKGVTILQRNDEKRKQQNYKLKKKTEKLKKIKFDVSMIVEKEMMNDARHDR